MKYRPAAGFILAGIAAVIFSFASCSLDYGKAETSENEIPELSFSDAQYNRFEDNKKTMQVQAGKIEQYKNDNSSFAKNVHFKTWNTKEELDTEGKCGLIAADSKSEQYTLFDNISIQIYGQNIRLIAENLRWNGKTEQLTSGKHDAVSLERDDISVSGKGFSASGVSRSFLFRSKTSGTITTKEESVETNAEQDAASGQTADTTASEIINLNSASKSSNGTDNL